MPESNVDQVLVNIRRIIQAIDLHSKKLVQNSGITVPQLILLKAIAAESSPTVGALAKKVSLSQGTATNILIRLEARGLIARIRSEQDKRRTLLQLTEQGEQLLASAPSLLHERFIELFNSLAEWEQHWILAALMRVAELMDAESLEAAPLLSADSNLAFDEDHTAKSVRTNSKG